MRILLLLIIIFNFGCSRMPGLKREIVIDSSVKEAEVSYLLPSGQFEVLGKTPITIEDKIITEWKKDNEFAVIKVSKSGFIVENLFIDLASRHKVNYFAKLNAIDMWNNKDREISSTSANALAIKVQKINQQVATKNLDSALASTENLIEQFPKAHVFYDIKGSILFLMGKKDESIGSYEKSLSLNPENNEAKQMLEKVKRVQ